MNSNVFHKFVGMLSYLAAPLILSGCLEDDSVEPTPIAYVSIYGASPDAPDLDVVLDNKLLFNQPLEYTDYTGYLQFYTGNRRLEFSEYNASTVFMDTTFNFQADKAYSVFVTDEVDELTTLIVEDSTSTPAEGKAWIRFVHLSPDAPVVDFLIEGENSTESFTNQSFEEASTFTEVDADTYSMLLTATGNDEELVAVPETDLESERVYTVVVRGYADPPAGNSNALSIQVVRNQ
ncbi:DUF4397 domain-containing protein [Catalinimonas alkaloidigena]|uniref:DUF4397 domain-containing protein n=1 Tax=Catalinimonas alkaloidigena TaxID=1075417 RepID=UPI002405210D|nr:DUF4397 domain-containing protein [Catalinimonas alkaloidigena]